MPSPDQVLLSLPNETLTTVFQLLGRDSLITLVRVCRRLQGVGERLLYGNVSIVENIHTNGPTFTPFKTLGCCSTVQRRPHLASAIKSLHVRWNRNTPAHYHECRIAPGVIPCLRHVLQLATQLEALELHLGGLRGSFADVLDGCTFQLRVLALSGPSETSIEWFLRAQPAVQHLHLGDQHHPLLLLGPRDLPALETFRGDARAAASIVPARPVCGLALSGQEPSEECLAAFARASTPIKWLDLANLLITPMHLLNISKHLTAVECLRMKLALRHTLHFTFSGMMLLEALTHVLRNFHSLARLDLSPTSVDGVRGVHTETDEASLCSTWASVCPVLRRVIFPSGNDWTLSAEGLWTSRQPGAITRQ